MKLYKYANPVSASEAALRFTIVQDNGSRVIIRCVSPITVGGSLHSQETVMRSDICEA